MHDPEDRFTDAELTAMLALLDHPVPHVSADYLLTRSRRRGSRRSMLIAAAAVVVTAGVAAAAVPSVTLRGLANQMFGRRMPPVPQIAIDAKSRSTSNVQAIAFVPRARAKIVFEATQSAGRLRVRVVPESSVRVLESGVEHRAQFALSPEGVSVRNAGSTASYELVIPVALARASVWIAGVRVYEKEGASVRCLRALAPDGNCLIPMRRGVETEP